MPVLVYLLEELVKDATTESLIVVDTAALAGAADHARIGRVKARTGLTFGATGVSGAIVGTALNRLVGGRAILLAFAVLLLVAAVAMLQRAPESPTRGRKPSFVRVAPVVLGTGVLTGLFGVGGGFVIAPALALLLGLPLAMAVGTSLLVIALTSGAALAAHLASGSIDWIIRVHLHRRRDRGSVSRSPGGISPQRLGRLFALLLVAIAFFLVAENVPALR